MSDIDALPRSAEAERAVFLRDCRVLDTPPEPAFDDITQLAASICNTSMALVSLLDGDRQWFKSRVGVDEAETPIAVSFCVHAICQPGICVVPDAAKDARFWKNPLVIGEPNIRFYAGAILENAAGVRLGTLCVLDSRPRPNGLTMQQADALQALARQVTAQLELRQVRAERVEETRHLLSCSTVSGRR
jgi:GAF domain-containing protein